MGHLLGHFHGKHVQIIGLKAPGNYSASIWYNTFSICFWERQKTLTSMILDFLDVSRSPPPKPTIFIFGDPKKPQTIQKNVSFDTILFSQITKCRNSPKNKIVGRNGRRQNPDDTSNQILKILYMKSISIEKHEMKVWKYGAIGSLKL